MSCKKIFSIRIKELRESQGLGIRELAKQLGISHTAILFYEGGKRTPNIDVCLLFADRFGVSCDYLIRRTDNK
jgi:transcriptional regulator with XRE-family HTH domain